MTSNNHLYESPITALTFTEDLKDVSINEQLVKMFQHPDVKTNQIVVFSVVGPYRKGKSFFLNYCLRYLYAHYPSINFINNPTPNPKEWMGADDEPLVGFSWRSGSDADTKGILIWNDVFLHTNEAGERIGIVLIDSQGLFARDSSQTEDSKIFALGTLISSIEVFNLSGVVQEDQLQYLQFAAEYAKFALNNENVDEKPFQKLFFLIRDWDNPQEYPFGCIGGQKYLQRFFNSKSSKADELKSVYEYLNNLFQDFSCSLLPNPGKVVSQGISKNQNEKYDGSLAEMDDDFREELAKVIEQILSPENLVSKRFNGKYLNGAEFLDHMQHYFEFFLSNEVPEVQTVLDSIVENEMKALLQQCVDKYKDEYRKSQKSLINLDQMQDMHENCKANALIMFKDSNKIGDPEDEIKCKQQLVEKIDDIYQEHVKQFEANEKKIEEEIIKLRIELEEKHERELEEIRRKIDAQKKIQEMELQKKKDDFEQKKKLIEEELENARILSEQKMKENQLKLSKKLVYDGNYADNNTKPANSNYNATGTQLSTEETLDMPEKITTNNEDSKIFPKNNSVSHAHENLNPSQNTNNSQSYDSQHKNSHEFNQQKQTINSRSTYVNDNTEHRFNQQQEDRPKLSPIANDKFNPNNEFASGGTPRHESTPENKQINSLGRSNQFPRYQKSFSNPETSNVAQSFQFVNIQSERRQLNPEHHYSQAEIMLSRQKVFLDQFGDDSMNDSQPKYPQYAPRDQQSLNQHFVYNQQSLNQQFVHNNQQVGDRYYNHNQGNTSASINRNYQQTVGHSNDGYDVQNFQRYGQSQGTINNYEVAPYQPNLYSNYSNTSEYNPQMQYDTQRYPPPQSNWSHYNQQSLPNYNHNIYKFEDQHSNFDRQRIENERELQENANRLAQLKAELLLNSQNEADEEIKKISNKKPKSKERKKWPWQKEKMPED